MPTPRMPRASTGFLPLCVLLMGMAVAAPGAAAELVDAGGARAAVLSLALERIALMSAVARVKWVGALPVSDPAREATVRAAALERAAQRGLATAPMKAWIDLQMRLARDRQAALHGRWSQQGCTDCARGESLASLREAIDAIDARALPLLYVLASAQHGESPAGRESTLPARLEKELRQSLPDAADRQALLDTLRSLRLAEQPGLERIRQSGILRIGTTGDYAPFSYENDGVLAGADIALGEALAASLGVQPVFLRTRWATLSADLQRDGFDIALGGVSITAERAAIGRFSRAYHAGGKTLIARCADAAHYASLEAADRPGVRLIANRGGTNERMARTLFREATLRVHPDNITVFREIAEGRADVMVTDDIEADLQARRDARLCRSLPGTLDRVEKALLLTPDTPLHEAVDRWLGEQIAAGNTTRWREQAIAQAVAP